MAILRYLLIGLILVVTGCPRGLPSMVQGPTALSLEGAARWSEDYRTQAVTSEVANGATVSLIDVALGQTVATTLTKSDGTFSLAIKNWSPEASHPYLLEAVKGLSAGGSANRVGASAARLRTMISFVNGAWTSLTGSTTLQLSRSTTALCVIASLKGLTPVQQQALMGTITIGTPDVFAANADVLAGEFTSVWGAVDSALTLNLDPVQAIARDTVTGAFSLMETGPVVTDFSALTGTVGSTVTLYGKGFDPNPLNNRVWFNGYLASTSLQVVNPLGTQLTVTIPMSTSGYVSVQVGNLLSTTASLFTPVYATGGIQTFAGTRVIPAGTQATAWGFGSTRALVSDGAGGFYVTTDTQVLHVGSNGIASTVAGTGATGFGGDGAAATAAMFSVPQALARDGSGNLYIADTNNHRIRMVPKVSGTYFGQAMTANNIYTVAGNGINSTSANGVAATLASINAPLGVAVDPAGNLYLSDSSSGRVRMVPKLDGTYFGVAMTANCMYTLAGTGESLFNGDGILATAANFWSPRGLALDATGNLYVADRDTCRIRMIAKTTGTYFGQAMTANYIYTVAGNGTGAFAGDGTLATTASTYDPETVSLDASGNLFITDSWSNHLRMVPRTTATYFGQAMTANYMYTIAGNGTSTYAGDGGVATSAQFNGPYGLTADAVSGNVFISDGPRVRMIARNSATYFGQSMTASYMYTVAGNGTAGFSGDGAAPLSSQLNSPQSVALDASGNRYIADTSNYRIRMVPKTSGTYFGQAMTANNIYTIAGGGTGGIADGVLATNATLLATFALILDASGNVYFSHAALGPGGSGRIFMLPRTNGTHFGLAMTANCLYTIAGNGTNGFTADGILATAGSVQRARGLSFDSAGNLYFFHLGRVRMIPRTSGTYFGQAMTANYIYTVAGNGTQTYAGDGTLATTASLFGLGPLGLGGVVVDASGNLIIADPGNYRIRMVPKTSGTYFGQAMTANYIYTIAGNGAMTYAAEQPGATNCSLSAHGLALDPLGNVLIADGGNHLIRMLPRTSGTYFGRSMTANNLYTIAGNFPAVGYAGDGGLATSASLYAPKGLAVDAAGVVYIADTSNGVIRSMN